MAMAFTVMVIDDDVDTRSAIATLLQSEGYAVIAAGGGREALGLLHGSKAVPHVVLLDLMMPDMDGMDFRRAQLADDRLAPIPVILFSATGRGIPDDRG